MWTLCGDDETADLAATSPDGMALLVSADGSTQTIQAVGGRYRIQLSGATNRNPFPGQDVNPIYPIGGAPVVLVEKDDRQPLPETSFLPLIQFVP